MAFESNTFRFPWLSVGLSVGALCAPFFFPWQAAVVLGIIAALFVPPLALVVGVLLDALHWSGSGLPLFSILGIFWTVVAYFVHQFVKTRIIS